jgi:hypothetical protein
MNTRVEGATVQIMVTAHATLSAGPAHLMLSAREGPAPGTWRYNLGDGQNSRIQYGSACYPPCFGLIELSASSSSGGNLSGYLASR